MKIHVVSVGDSLSTVGVRKMAAYIQALNPDATSYYIPLINSRSFRNILRNLRLAKDASDLTGDAEACAMAQPIADADIVAFSSMSNLSEQTKAIIRQVRRINPRAYIIWGGIHPIMVPEDAIQCADAVCTGEGEFAFEEFFDAFRNERDYTDTQNFWFKRNGRVIRNGFRPLMTSREMDTLPLPSYGENEYIYERNQRTFVQSKALHYINQLGLSYYTVWTIGCPFHCTYCGNTRFLQNHPTYGKLRHSSPQWVVDEIIAARRIHPHVSRVTFTDDSFLALPVGTLEEFACRYKSKIRLPFCILGVIPNYVTRNKLEILLKAGLVRVRMGIQSGSQRILDFYKRPSPPAKILRACATLADYSKNMVPPNYDIIVDNPIETREDVVETLELIYKMRRPFTFNIFSLRILPNTELAKRFEELGISADSIQAKSFQRLAPTFANCILVLLCCVRPSRWLFNRLLKRVKPFSEDQKMYPTFAMILRFLFFVKRLWSNVLLVDSSLLPGRVKWLLWRVGVVDSCNRLLLRKFKSSAVSTSSKGKKDYALQGSACGHDCRGGAGPKEV